VSSILAAGLFAQSKSPEFEVATVKRSQPPPGDRITMNLGSVRNGRVTFTNATLGDCLKFAYNLVSDSQLGGLDWVKSKMFLYDVVAQAPPDTPREQLLLMLQALLAERMKLVLHHELKEFSYLALAPGKNGLKLRETTPGSMQVRGPNGPGHIVHNEMSMTMLARLLSRFEHELILDMTGLKSTYEVNLEWTPETVENGTAPSLYTAIQQELGLKLDRRKGPVDILIVDQADKIPIDN
jgi:uncharacterized protein (TIGR03435 family)